jgi:hypothetical protein
MVEALGDGRRTERASMTGWCFLTCGWYINNTVWVHCLAHGEYTRVLNRGHAEADRTFDIGTALKRSHIGHRHVSLCGSTLGEKETRLGVRSGETRMKRRLAAARRTDVERDQDVVWMNGPARAFCRRRMGRMMQGGALSERVASLRWRQSSGEGLQGRACSRPMAE